MAVVLLLLVAGSTISSGCLGICPPGGWNLRWIQEGLYEKLPTNGTKAGFQLFENDHACCIYREARKELDGYFISLRLDRDSPAYNVSFSVHGYHRDDRPSDEVMKQWAFDAFRDLELGEPRPPNWNFKKFC